MAQLATGIMAQSGNGTAVPQLVGSGSIRRVLGQQRKHAKTLLAEVAPVFTHVKESATHENVSNAKQTRVVMANLRDKCEASRQKLTERDIEWRNVLTNLEALSNQGMKESQVILSEEEQKYTEHLESAEGHLNLIQQLEDKIIGLNIGIQSLEEYLQKVTGTGTGSLAQQHNSNLATTAAGQSQPNTTQRSAPRLVEAKLPKLELKDFNGDIIQWDAWWQSYEQVIHKRTDMAIITKFQYLLKYVTGEAFDAIKGIRVVEQNYELAIEILQKQYGKTRDIKRKLYAKLQQVQDPKGHYKSLQNFHREVQSLVYQLRSQNEDMNNYATVEMIRSKIPGNIRLEIVKIKGEDQEWSVANILSSLEKIIEQRKEADTDTSERQESSFSKNLHQKRDQKPTTTTSAFSASATNNNPYCIFCEGSHFSSECRKYATTQHRMQKLMQSKDRCSKCTRKGHFRKDCRTNLRCFYCKVKNQHASALCTEQFSNGVKESKQSSGGHKSTNQGTKPQTMTAMAMAGKPGSSTEVNRSNAGDRLQQSTEQTLKSTVDVDVTNATLNKTETGTFQYRPVRMQTAKAMAYNPEDQSVPWQSAKIFLDSGAQRTFVSKEFMKKLKLQPKIEVTIGLGTFGTKKKMDVNAEIVELDLQLKDGSRQTITASAIETLATIQPHHDLSKDDWEFIHQKWGQQADKLFAEPINSNGEQSVPDIVLGLDVYWDFLTKKDTIKLPSGMHVVKSKFGLMINGQDGATNRKAQNNDAFTVSQVTEQSYDLAINNRSDSSFTQISNPRVEEFWELETIGIKDCPIINDDEKAAQQFHATTEYKDLRYHVKWPYKDCIEKLQDNKAMSLQRHKALTNRFAKDDKGMDLLQRYNKVIEEQLQKGIIEKVYGQPTDNRKIHYLAHQPVETPGKTTTKLRIVYDASASIKNHLSLNDCLHRGPVILPELAGLLLRFRAGNIGIIADIEKAFLQVVLQEPDRDLTRWWWYKDPTKPVMENNLQLYRFVRMPFGVISSPWLLGAVITHHLQVLVENESLANAHLLEGINDGIYVDNLIFSVDSVDLAKEKYDVIKAAFNLASMNMRDWTTNSAELRKCFNADDKSETKEVTVLGLHWDTETDTLNISKPKGAHNPLPQKLTKRVLVQLISAIFDPLGMLCPVTVTLKALMQQIWAEIKSKGQLEWETKVPEQYNDKFTEIKELQKQVNQIKWSRTLEPIKPSEEMELHVFTDASKQAYAASAYLRQQSKDGEFAMRLIFAKSRVAPKQQKGKPITIPRLELLGLTIGARMVKFLLGQVAEWNIVRSYLWTDSICCLWWLHSNKTMACFVKNRILEIQAIQTETSVQVNKIDTADNPADIASRGCDLQELQQKEIWWTGPMGFKTELPPDFQPESEPVPPDLKPEIEQEFIMPKSSIWVGVTTQQEPEMNDFMAATENHYQIDPNRFSKWDKLLRVTIRVMRFVAYLKNQKRSACQDITLNTKKAPFMESEWHAATEYWVKVAQQIQLADQIKQIKEAQKQNVPFQKHLGITGKELKFDSVKKIVKVMTRIPDMDCNQELYLLPQKGCITKLIIEHYHRSVMHAGVAHTLAELRENFWIHRGRVITHNIIKHCMVCRKVTGRPYKQPVYGTLPQERAELHRPFHNVGMDYFGPLWYQVVDESGQKMHKKAYVLLITCLSTRAVHLELVPNMTAAETQMAFTRFESRRNTPHKIWLDNAPQFKQLARNLPNIQWNFITPFAPWQGGVYERIVGIIKQLMKKAQAANHNPLLSWMELSTMVLEVERVSNSRPLTYVGDTIDSLQVLRPMDFLLGDHTGSNPVEKVLTENESHQSKDPDPEYTPAKNEKQKMTEIWDAIQQKKEKLWQLWQKLYLDMLRQRYNFGKQSNRDVTAEPKVGAVVLIKEQNLPRGAWKLGKIHKLNRSKDGWIRSAEVQLKSGKHIERPIVHLCPLEVQDHDGQLPEKVDNTVELGDPQNPSDQPAKAPTTKNDAPDQSLQAPETRKNPHRAARRQQTYADFFMVGLQVLTIISVIMSGVETTTNWQQKYNKQFNLCTKAKNGHAIAIPDKIYCKFPVTDKVRKQEVNLWAQRLEPQKAIAYRCYIDHHIITTNMGFFGSKGIIGDIHQFEEVDTNECWNAVKTQEWKSQEIMQLNDDLWSTNQTLQVEYKWCCTDKNNEAINFVIEKGQVASLDGHRLVSDLQDLSACSPLAGYCHDVMHAVTVWNGTKFKHQCAYEFQGKYAGSISRQSVIIEEIQSAYSVTHRNKWPADTECVPQDAFYVDQGAVYLQFKTELKEFTVYKPETNNNTISQIIDAPIEAVELGKIQYTAQKILEMEKREFGFVWQQMCTMKQSQLDMIRQLFRLNPTMGIRALMGREDVHAEWAGEAVIFWECKRVKPIKVHFAGKYEGTCYKYTPVQIEPGGQLYFISPGSSDLLQHSPTEDCRHATPHYFQLDNGEWTTANGPGHVHVSTLPIELTWKGKWTAFTLNASSIFHISLANINFNLWEANYHFQKLQQLEHMTRKLTDYTASWALDPAVIKNSIAGVGQGIGGFYEGVGKEIGHIVKGTLSGSNSICNGILKGPVQFILNLLLIGGAIFLTGYGLYMYGTYRVSKGLPLLPIKALGSCFRAVIKLLGKCINMTTKVARAKPKQTEELQQTTTDLGSQKEINTLGPTAQYNATEGEVTLVQGDQRAPGQPLVKYQQHCIIQGDDIL